MTNVGKISTAIVLSVLLLGGSVGIITSNVAYAHPVPGNLPSGVPIEVSIDSPISGTVFQLGDDVVVEGTASIGEGVPVADTTIIYVVDDSGSTGAPGGSCGEQQTNDAESVADEIIDCEILAAINLNDQAITLGTVDEVAIITFAGDAAVADATPAGGDDPIIDPGADANSNGDNDVDEVLHSIRTAVLVGEEGGFTQFAVKNLDIFNTDFGDGISKALEVAASASNPNVMVVFMSDGSANTGVAVDTLLPSGDIVFHTFAVGGGASCGSDPNNLGSLQEIADLTGGTCTDVTDPATLPDILPGFIASMLDSLELGVDGVFSPIDNADIDPDLPVVGPASVEYTTTVSGLTAGDHDICVRANGHDAGGNGAVTDCHTIHVNVPPDCTTAGPNVDTLWPPNHKMQSITIEGLTDPEGDPVTITIDSIFQDEPTNGLGDGDQSPDGAGIGTDTAQVRAERSGTGDGRVYHILFTADDGNGGTCTGEVLVSVPHDQGTGSAVDQGALFDSTV